MPHVSYYQEYIELEVRKGRREEEVIQELGSPRLIGKNIADAFLRKEELAKGPFLKRALHRLPDASQFSGLVLHYGKSAVEKCAEASAQAARKAKTWFDGIG